MIEVKVYDPSLIPPTLVKTIIFDLSATPWDVVRELAKKVEDLLEAELL